jgi:hypothetical protein
MKIETEQIPANNKAGYVVVNKGEGTDKWNAKSAKEVEVEVAEETQEETPVEDNKVVKRAKNR